MTAGPYGWVRHPLYLAALLIWSGLALALQSPVAGAVTLLYVLPGALCALVLAYRRTALEHPGHYAILFGNAIPGFLPSDTSRLKGLEGFGRLERAIERCLASV